jgi:hypothetical protein
MYLKDYSSSVSVLQHSLISSNEASFGAVFAGNGFVELRDESQIISNFAETPLNLLMSSPDLKSVGFGSLYWFEGTRPPSNNNKKNDPSLNPCRCDFIQYS